MSKALIFKGGTVAARPFASSLSEIPAEALSPRKRSAHDAAEVRRLIMEEARAEGHDEGIAIGLEEGRVAGYQAGFDQAHSEATNRHAEALRAFAAELQVVRDGLSDAIDSWFQASESELETMAVEIAKRLLDAQLTLDRSFIKETTQTALHRVAQATNARIRVNPFDSALLREAREELMASTATLRGIEIVDDASIVGGCMIETERGAVDATIDKRLEILEGGLEEAA